MRECEVAQFGIKTSGGEVVYVRAFTVPFICDQLNKQPIDLIERCYPHLRNLKLANYSFGDEELLVQILIGADYYWSFVDETIIKG